MLIENMYKHVQDNGLFQIRIDGHMTTEEIRTYLQAFRSQEIISVPEFRDLKFKVLHIEYWAGTINEKYFASSLIVEQQGEVITEPYPDASRRP
jgi:hypothetical protein